MPEDDDLTEEPKPARKTAARPAAKPAAAKPRASGGKTTAKPGGKPVPRRSLLSRLRRWAFRAVMAVVAFYALLILLFSFVPPPVNLYQLSESVRLGSIDKDWVSWDEIAPVMGRSAVAAEDANFCNHWGFDMAAIRQAIEQGGNRGASTISQQVVKNVFLWHDRNWLRKAMEAALTPAVELVWSKRRILEVYLNVAEFGEGVFGVQAAARHHFGVDARDLTEVQAARLAAVLPAPKLRDPAKPTDSLRRRARSILSGAETIAADGRSACFED